MQSGIIEDLSWRGLIAQTSDQEGLATHLHGSSRTLYCGFDPTADSLHVGSLVPLLALRRFQLAGHRPIALVGGATGLIGDPSFKTAERSLNDPHIVAGWVEKLRVQVSGFLDFSGNYAAVVVDNLAWIRELSVIDFLRDIGKHFSVNAMIGKDAVRSRLAREGEGISFTEFTYSILQSLDYLELAKRYGCSLQIGGSDQWGNITAGMDLVRRVLSREAYALTFPLVTQSDGTKFGKTEAGTIWLDPKKTSPYAFYQFWLNTADESVSRLLRWFTFLERHDVEEIEQEVIRAPEQRLAQSRLAEEMTRLIHGDAAARSAQRISAALFGGDVRQLRADELEQLRFDGLPSTTLDVEEITIVNAIERAGIASSRSAARRLVDGGGVSVNGAVVSNVEQLLTRASAMLGRYHLVRRGRKSWHLLVHGSSVD